MNILLIYKKLTPIIYDWPVFPIIGRNIIVARITRSYINRTSRNPALLSAPFCTTERQEQR
jgi:hypothetical protein